MEVCFPELGALTTTSAALLAVIRVAHCGLQQERSKLSQLISAVVTVVAGNSMLQEILDMSLEQYCLSAKHPALRTSCWH